MLRITESVRKATEENLMLKMLMLRELDVKDVDVKRTWCFALVAWKVLCKYSYEVSVLGSFQHVVDKTFQRLHHCCQKFHSALIKII